MRSCLRQDFEGLTPSQDQRPGPDQCQSPTLHRNKNVLAHALSPSTENTASKHTASVADTYRSYLLNWVRGEEIFEDYGTEANC